MLYYALVYGLLTIVGGVIGYLKVGSKISLYTGIGSGVLILLNSIMLLQGQTLGFYGLSGITLALIIVFAVRTLKTQKMMPSGMMLGLSAVMAVLLVLNRAHILTGSH